MQNQQPQSRRSSRLSLEIPINIASADPAFQERCHTIVVSMHGCAVLVSQNLTNGTPVVIELDREKRSTNARVVMSIAIGSGAGLTLLGLEFDEPGNFWGIENPPEDWKLY